MNCEGHCGDAVGERVTVVRIFPHQSVWQDGGIVVIRRHISTQHLGGTTGYALLIQRDVEREAPWSPTRGRHVRPSVKTWRCTGRRTLKCWDLTGFARPSGAASNPPRRRRSPTNSSALRSAGQQEPAPIKAAQKELLTPPCHDT